MIPNITKEEYLRDLENTRKEAAAYKQIADGFAVLARLPENQGSEQARLNFHSKKYLDLYIRCQALLEALEGIADQFGA